MSMRKLFGVWPLALAALVPLGFLLWRRNLA
jgi:hypothetical protein